MTYQFHAYERVYHRQTKSSGTVRSVSVGHMGSQKVHVVWDHRPATTELASDLVAYSPLQQLADVTREQS